MTNDSLVVPTGAQGNKDAIHLHAVPVWSLFLCTRPTLEVDAGRLTTACAWLRSRSRAALREMSEDTHTQHPSLSRCSQQNEKRKAPGVCVLQSLNFDPYLAFLPLISGKINHLSYIS